MKTKKFVVEQIALRCVTTRRRLVVEVAENSSLDPHLLRRQIADGDKDFGPFRFQIVSGTAYMRPVSLRVIRETKLAADIPLSEEWA